jgi:hypothetical protein
MRRRAVVTRISIGVLPLEERGGGLWIGKTETGQKVAR